MTHPLNLEQVSFEIILHAGNARSSAMEALQCVKKSEYESANQKIQEADAELLQAHQAQTRLLQKEAQGQRLSPNLLLIHAQDHLMTSMTLKDLANEMIHLYQALRRGSEA
ncbi:MULTISPECIES: PTS lactose/cellobiose transporter subunit IIA [unclassified Bacillus (in: firmicutes)]|uniref:PTS lactose/cellobiose transporter subunit IIA n=1 Tax=unclassified Bacillus (in: firmicutes) TaxID=185979 RepID=UPI0004019B73|nr:PTS lactose/cellobiose transporter subunit IIA [Bacillus sp. NSP9.1]QHZ48716.1 PTS lactose/cellobiose transporter subunit IIA [Bacillus sp. NSP9.1]